MERARQTREEIGRRGDQIYENVVRPQVELGNHGKVVAIDVNSEAFELGENAIDASEKLLARFPNAEIWFVRVGHPALHRIGGHAARERQ